MRLSTEQRILRGRLSRTAQDYFDQNIAQDISQDFCVFALENEANASTLADLIALHEEFQAIRAKTTKVAEEKSKLTKLQAMRIATKVMASIDVEEVQSFLSRVNTASDHDEIVNDYISEVKAEVEAELKNVLTSSKIKDIDFDRVNAELKLEIKSGISNNIVSIDLDEPLGS